MVTTFNIANNKHHFYCLCILGSMRSNKAFRTTINQHQHSDNVHPPAVAKESNITNSRSNLPTSQVHIYANLKQN